MLFIDMVLEMGIDLFFTSTNTLIRLLDIEEASDLDELNEPEDIIVELKGDERVDHN